MSRVVTVGSRQSALAMLQTHLVVDALQQRHPRVEFRIVPMTTLGDRVTSVPLAQIGDRGLFVKELERALIMGDIDLAVHSLKDLPSRLSSTLTIAAVMAREDARDVLVSRLKLRLDRLPLGARVGTSSLRRAAQLLHRRPDLQIVNLRGNVDTRLRRAQTEEYDAVVLAAAGLLRLGRAQEIVEYLPLEVCLPAVGQGALAVETRAGDDEVRDLAAAANDAPTYAATSAERSFLARLEGGCQIPIGAYARIEGDQLILDGMLASTDGRRLLRDREQGAIEQAMEIGIRLAERILSAGGSALR